ncbi:hypothetical protein CBS101457_004954 [Exobasidium rhododendri]|nr:hypothetical protein CBS101457_004954 [Exobasidium rhododendri]
MSTRGPAHTQDAIHPFLQADISSQVDAQEFLYNDVLQLRRQSDIVLIQEHTTKKRSYSFRSSQYSPYAHEASQVSTTSSSKPLPFLRELFISPHPDDICYSCFGTAVQKEGNPNNTHNGRMIVTVFSQSRCCNGHLAEKLNRNVSVITDVRKEEDESFAKSVNCRLLQLGLSDSSARDEFSRKEDLAIKSKAEMAEATKMHPSYARVQQALNDIIRWAIKCKAAIYLPLGIGCHIDHMMTRVAAESIMEEIRRESPTKKLPVMVTYYEDLPYAFYQTEETIEKMATTVIAGKSEVCLVPLDDELWERKTAAVQAYVTQMKPTILPSMESRAIFLAGSETHSEEEGTQRRERTWILSPGEWLAGF